MNRNHNHTQTTNQKLSEGFYPCALGTLSSPVPKLLPRVHMLEEDIITILDHRVGPIFPGSLWRFLMFRLGLFQPRSVDSLKLWSL